MKKRFAMMVAVAGLAAGLFGGQSASADHTSCGGRYQGYVVIDAEGVPVGYCSDGTFDGINETAGTTVVPEAEGDVAHGCEDGEPVQIEIDLDPIADGTSWCAPLYG
ncbi:MAG TPA: hypothetical protein VGB64_15415 [Actinomycetota bacterium]